MLLEIKICIWKTTLNLLSHLVFFSPFGTTGRLLNGRRQGPEFIKGTYVTLFGFSALLKGTLVF